MFKQVVHHTQKEIESVTSNHGTKFLRNTASCLILAAIIGGISGWYINRYLPKFVTLEKTGNITIHHSNVRVLETGKVSNDN
jgi:membrane protein YqaA with SNARE-associated domain